MSKLTEAIIIIIVITAAVTGLNILLTDSEGPDDTSKQGGELIRSHTFYGSFDNSNEHAPAWNCLTQGNKTCG